jgi:poly-gamma-glutamate synthesis protein (capsule biosynthesis protein)
VFVRLAVTVTLSAGVMSTLAAAATFDAIESGAIARSQAVRLTPPQRSLSVIAGGDVLIEERVRVSAATAGSASGVRFDFGPMFLDVEEVIEATDLAICHMETPIGRPGGSYGSVGRSPFGGNLLVAPHEIAIGLRDVGFDRCSTASNHANDLGPSGIDSTIEALNLAGITTSGTARREEEAAVSPFDANGVRVAHLAYTTDSNTATLSEPWRLAHTRDPARIARDVDAARRSGAEVVLVSLHVLKELQPGPTTYDRELVTSFTSMADVDAVFVHGPHVVQPFEMVAGTPVWWSLGNFVSEMGPPSMGRYAEARTSDGLLAFVRFDERASGGFDVVTASVAVCNDFEDRTVRPATLGLARTDLSNRVRDELSQCLARTRQSVPSAY